MTDNSFCDLNLRSLPKAPTWREDMSKEAGLKRLRVLASFLEQVPDERYDQNEWQIHRECGTVACALGWAGTVLTELTGFMFEGISLRHDGNSEERIDIFERAEAIFGLDSGHGADFFSGTNIVKYPILKDEDGLSFVQPRDAAAYMHAYVDERIGKDV